VWCASATGLTSVLIFYAFIKTIILLLFIIKFAVSLMIKCRNKHYTFFKIIFLNISFLVFSPININNLKSFLYELELDQKVLDRIRIS